MAAPTFTCEGCGGTFEKAWSDAEANAEAETLWGVETASADERMAAVCEDCFRRMMPPEADGTLPG